MGGGRMPRPLSPLALLLSAVPSAAPGPDACEVTLLVRNQATPRDAALLADMAASAAAAGWPRGCVVGMADAQRELGHSGLWTYKPWLFEIGRRARRASGLSWLVFLEPATEVDVGGLAAALGRHDSQADAFLGRILKDPAPSIIHHYSQEPPYPHALAGFALSGALARRLAEDLEAHPLGSNQQIEPVWELADWIKKLGVDLVDQSDVFCLEQRAGCATWVGRRDRHRASHGLTPRDVVVAVKTVGKFHSKRLPLIHEHWAAASTAEVLYLSNEPFSDIPGASVVDLSPEFGSRVDPAVESTKHGSGHCAKMEALLTHLAQSRPGKRWYVVTDDDTLLNVPRLLRVLDSHDDGGAVYLGERYGWSHREEHQGTNYITTGGGMALSGPALVRLRSCESCTCGDPSAPDDMTLGTWFARLNIAAVHEEGFHQSEPFNYHPELLRHGEEPVSFHRFGVRLPASATEAQKDAARRENWGRWAREHFGPRGRAGADEL